MSKNKKILLIFIILGSLVSTINVGAMRRRRNKKTKKPKVEINTSKTNKQEDEKKENSNKEENYTDNILEEINQKYEEFENLEIPNLEGKKECEDFLNSLNKNHKTKKISFLFTDNYNLIKETVENKIKAIDKKNELIKYNKDLDEIKNKYENATSKEKIKYDDLILTISENLNENKDFADKIRYDNLKSIDYNFEYIIDPVYTQINKILYPVLGEIEEIIILSNKKIEDLKKLKQSYNNKQKEVEKHYEKLLNIEQKYKDKSSTKTTPEEFKIFSNSINSIFKFTYNNVITTINNNKSFNIKKLLEAEKNEVEKSMQNIENEYNIILNDQNEKLGIMQKYYENINSKEKNEENKKFYEDEKRLCHYINNLNTIKEFKYKNFNSSNEKIIDDQFKKINNIKKYIETIKKETEDNINKLKNEISRYKDILTNIDKISQKDKEEEIKKAEQDLDEIESFIKKNGQEKEIKNFKLRVDMEKLISNFNHSKKHLEFIKEIIKDTKEKENLLETYKTEIQDIEEKYINATEKQIKDYENSLSKIKTDLEKFIKFTYKTRNMNFKTKIKETQNKIEELEYKIKYKKINNQASEYFKELEKIEKNIEEKNKDLTSTNFEEYTKLTNQIDDFIIKNLEEFKNNEEMIEKLKDLKKKSDEIKKIYENTQKKKQEYVKIKLLLDNDINLLDQIENNYKNVNLDKIKKYKNILNSLPCDLEMTKEFANEIKTKEFDTKIENINKKINNINNLLETRKKEIEDINKIKNDISSYNETLNNIKNNINNKNLDFDIKEIYKTQQNFETIESFIKKTNAFADKIKNKNLKNEIENLSKNLSNVQNFVASTIKIKEIEKEIALYSTSLKLIEEDYIDYNLEEIMEEEKTLSSINNFINESMEFVKDKKNKEIINNLSNFSKNVNYIQNLLETRKKEIEISHYNETLDNIKNNNSNFDVKKIHEAQQNFGTIESFIKKTNAFADKIKNKNLKNEIENLSKNLSDVQNFVASTIKIKEIEKEIALHFENLKSIEENYSKYSPEEIVEKEKVLSSTVSFLKENMEFVKDKQNNIKDKQNNEILEAMYNLANGVSNIQDLLDARKEEIEISHYNETLDNINYDDISNYKKFKEIEQELNSISSFIKEANTSADKIKNENLKNEIEKLSDKIFKINDNSSSKNIEDFEDIFSISKNIEKFKTFKYKNENSNLENKEKNIDKEIENSLKPIKEFFENFNDKEIEKQIKIYEEYLDSMEKNHKSYNSQEINDALTFLISIKNNLDNFSKFAEEKNTKKQIQKLEEKIEEIKNLILNETKFPKDMELIYSKLNNKK